MNEKLIERINYHANNIAGSNIAIMLGDLAALAKKDVNEGKDVRISGKITINVTKFQTGKFGIETEWDSAPSYKRHDATDCELFDPDQPDMFEDAGRKQRDDVKPETKALRGGRKLSEGSAVESHLHKAMPLDK